MSSNTTALDRYSKEELVINFLSSRKGGFFLEIGVGPLPVIPRLKFLAENGVTYVGADFISVVEEHKKLIRKNGLGEYLDNGLITFTANSTGSYNYNLLKLLRSGQKFDIIYLDGHHTLQVDLPAAILASALLKPGGLFAIDDIEWSLSKVAKIMHDNFDMWLFYRHLYKFEDYEPEEIREKGMKAIVEDVLIPHLGFTKHPTLSHPGWAVLEKLG